MFVILNSFVFLCLIKLLFKKLTMINKVVSVYGYAVLENSGLIFWLKTFMLRFTPVEV